MKPAIAARFTSAAVSASDFCAAEATTPISAMKPWFDVAGLLSAYLSWPFWAAFATMLQVTLAATSGLSQPSTLA